MNKSIVTRLVAKDLYLYRWFIVGSTVGNCRRRVSSQYHR
jgi:hypothetical protein